MNNHVIQIHYVDTRCREHIHIYSNAKGIENVTINVTKSPPNTTVGISILIIKQR
jgi:hypothetical protein